MDYNHQQQQQQQQQQYYDQSIMAFPAEMPFPYPQPPMMYPWPMLYNNPYMQAMPSPSVPKEWKRTEVSRKIYMPMIADPQIRGQTIDGVSGRLCLLSSSKKYVVTVGEVCRRISAPETLHTSMINGILRNGKAKDNGTKLRAKLLNYNVQLPQGRRKTCSPTGFTALCEGESIEMATDLRSIIARDGGVTDIGLFLRDIETKTGRDFIPETEIVKKWLLQIIEFHPDTTSCDNIVPKNSAEHCVYHLSLLTHGFSHVAVPVIMRFVIAIMENVLSPKDEERLPMPQKLADEDKPLNQETAMSMCGMMPPDATQPSQTPFADATNHAPPFGSGGFYPYGFNMFPSWPQQQQIMQQMGFDGGPYMASFVPGTTPTPARTYIEKTYNPLLGSAKDRITKFDEVSGRLLLLSQSHKYVVTTGEVCRRMAAPETLHTSIINGILRNAKAKDNGTLLRSKLQNYNIQLPQGRRKTCTLTKYTALCEAEARSLAQDFEKLLNTDEHGGAEEIGGYLAEKEATEGNREALARDGPIVMNWLQKIVQVHMNGADVESLKPKNDAERAVHHLSLITHGFSHIAIPAVLSYVSKIMEAAINANPSGAPSAPSAHPLDIPPMPTMTQQMPPMPPSFFPPPN